MLVQIVKPVSGNPKKEPRVGNVYPVVRVERIGKYEFAVLDIGGAKVWVRMGVEAERVG